MNDKLSELLKDYPDVINVLERKQDSNLEEYLEYALVSMAVLLELIKTFQRIVLLRDTL